MMRFWAGLCSVVLFSMLLAVPAGAQDPENEIVLTALHAIPGENDFPADVYLNGELAIEGFTKMMKTDPFVVPPGELLIEIFPAGSDPSSATPAVSQVLELTEPGNFALVAQLVGAGTPVLSLYLNDISGVPMGHGRFVFRQTSAGGPVDVFADGELVAGGLETSDEVTATLPAGTVELSVAPSEGGDPLVTSDVELLEGELTIVYAISTADENVLDLAVQTVAGIETAPAAIETGTGGHAAAAAQPPLWRFALLGVALAVIAVGLHSAMRRDTGD